MKFLVVLCALFAVSFAQINRQYQPEKYARILKQNYDISPDSAKFSYDFETENGITGQAQGYHTDLGGVPPQLAQTVLGTFSWYSPEGKYISIGYSADENGYHPVGDAIPTPPPIPDYILRSIEYNKREEARKKGVRF